MNKNKKRLRRLSLKTVNGGLQLSPVPSQIYLSRISATAWCLSASPQGLCLSLAAGNLPRSGASWKRTKTHDSWDNIWGNKPHRSPSNLFLITYEVPKQRRAIQPRLQAPLSLSWSRGWVGGDPGSEVGFNWHFVCGLIMGRWFFNYKNFLQEILIISRVSKEQGTRLEVSLKINLLKLSTTRRYLVPTSSAIARMWYGSNPQHPPIYLTPKS